MHYAIDVLAGAAIGAACGAVAWLVFGSRPIASLLGWADHALNRLGCGPVPQPDEAR